jgi:hypothetical protein
MLEWKVVDQWNLVSAGPSREFLRPEHLLDGPVVTVNRAIDVVARGIRVDFAAIADGPSEKYWRPGCQLWVTLRPVQQNVRPEGMDTNVQIPGPPIAWLWDQALPASIGFRFMPTGTVRDFEDATRHRHAFSALCALKRIWQFKPRRVRILCADMTGSWIAGMTEAECHAHDMEKLNLNRWAHERRAMEAEIKRGRKEYGVEIDQVTPEPLVRVAG